MSAIARLDLAEAIGVALAKLDETGDYPAEDLAAVASVAATLLTTGAAHHMLDTGADIVGLVDVVAYAGRAAKVTRTAEAARDRVRSYPTVDLGSTTVELVAGPDGLVHVRPAEAESVHRMTDRLAETAERSAIDLPPGWSVTSQVVEVDADWRCRRCGAARWVAASLDEGRTRIRQCVPCGAYSQDPAPSAVGEVIDVAADGSDVGVTRYPPPGQHPRFR